MKFELDEDDQVAYDNELDLMAQDSGIFKDLRLKIKNLIHKGVQTLSSDEVHTHTLSDKID